jgi:transposase-like protein
MRRDSKRRKKDKGQRTLGQELEHYMKRGLREFVVMTGMSALEALLESERLELCGERYAHQEGRRAYRYGHCQGELVLGGRKVRVRRPRVRSVDDEEVMLPSWQIFSETDPLAQRIYEQMLIGVSTRKYARSLEPVDESVKEYGTSKSAASRHFVEVTQEQMSAWLERNVSDIKLVVLMIDGIEICGHMMMAALGIDEKGHKHVLGIREGATEHSSVCTALLTDLRDRGLELNASMLTVLDGGKALRKAVLTVFGKNALIQRCQVHKIRNVIDHLPDTMKRRIEALMWDAYRCADYDKAKRSLEAIHTTLEHSHPGAASSLMEGLEETLTVLKLGLPVTLVRVLGNTNMIESLFSQARQTMHRVKRWQGGRMIERWVGTALIDIESRFRKIRHYDQLGLLINALNNKNTLEQFQIAA